MIHTAHFFSHFRWKHRGHVVCVSLPVPGGVADSARGLGGVVSELCDLLQGEGDQLQGESPDRQVARLVPAPPAPPAPTQATPNEYRVWMDCIGQCLQMCVLLLCLYPLFFFFFVAVGV